MGPNLYTFLEIKFDVGKTNVHYNMYIFFIQLSLAEYTSTEIRHQTWGPFADGRTGRWPYLGPPFKLGEQKWAFSAVFLGCFKRKKIEQGSLNYKFLSGSNNAKVWYFEGFPFFNSALLGWVNSSWPPVETMGFPLMMNTYNIDWMEWSSLKSQNGLPSWISRTRWWWWYASPRDSSNKKWRIFRFRVGPVLCLEFRSSNRW